jgi:hypothetical protein
MRKILFLLMLLLVLLFRTEADAKKVKLKLNLYSNYYWESLALNKDSLWNPELIFEPGPTQAHSRFSLNLESRLKFGEMKLVVSPLVVLKEQEHVDIQLRECYGTLGFKNFEITAGKSIIKLGTGYMFTPISVITPERNISDPEDSLRSNQGVELVKLDYYLENFNLSVMVFKRKTRANAALMVYYHLLGIDWYGIGYYADYKKFEGGLAFSFTIGDNIEIHGEWMCHKRAPVDFHKVYFESDPRITYSTSPLYNPGPGNYNECILGANITFKKINIIAEYYHRDWGLKPEWWDRLKNYYRFHIGNAPDLLQSLDISSGLSIIQQGTRGLMRDYLFLRAAPFIKKNIDFSAILFMNLHDRSTVFLLNLENRVAEGITLYLKPVFFIGKEGSEFKESWYSHSLQLGMRLQK